MTDGAELDPTTPAARFAARMADIKARSRAEVSLSPAERLAFCERWRPGTVAALMRSLSPTDRLRLLFAWRGFWARPKQLAPLSAFDVWLLLGGRGVGKTRTGAEWTWERIKSGDAREVALVGPSFGEIRKIMVGGFERRADGYNGSGLLDILPPWVAFEVKEQKGEVRFPQYDARCYFVSAEKPEYRGGNPDTVWADEPIAWADPETLLANIFLSNRKRGRVRPQMCMTTTPRPVQFLRDLIMDDGTVVTHATSWENASNLAPGWIERMARTMGGTRQGQQELEGELLGDNPDALIAASVIDQHRVAEAPELDRVAVAIDPAVSQHRKSDDTGIVAVGRAGRADDGHLFVLADATKRYTWDGWATAAFELAEAHGASVFVVERNRSGDAAAANLRTAGVNRGFSVRTKSDGKTQQLVGPGGRSIEIVEILAMGDKAGRAGPLSTAYERGRVHHVGRLPRLETEVTEWDPKSAVSPNGLDALVHAATELLELDRPAKADGREAMRGFVEANERLRGMARGFDRESMVDVHQPGGRTYRERGSFSALLSDLSRRHGGRLIG